MRPARSPGFPRLRSRHRVALLQIVCLSGFCCETPLGAQEISGHLLETTSGRPIGWASIALLDTMFTAVADAITNGDGAFLLRAPGPGAYYVLAEALGYAPRMDGVLELDVGGSVTVEFYLRPKPIELDSLKVALTRVKTYRHLSDVGYYERLNLGFGTFITPETIERRNPATPTDLLRGVPDLNLGQQTAEGTRVYLMRGGYACDPAIYVDGTRVVNDPQSEAGGPMNIESIPRDWEGGALPNISRNHHGVLFDPLVDVRDISAVEVHTRNTSIPLLYGGTQETCGVILIWTHLAAGKAP